MKIPSLDRSRRIREYNGRSFEEVAEIVGQWLFRDDVGHREMDRDILGLDPSISKGWQSMGVLHYLGLKKEFKGLFLGLSREAGIELLATDDQDFRFIIELLNTSSENYQETLIAQLAAAGEKNDPNFKKNYEYSLSELRATDRHSVSAYGRVEQGLLRALLFGGKSQAQCALCHKELPTDLLVTAHIKPRSKCSTSERINPNVVMPVCKLGCDDFFEKGYVVVDMEGFVRITGTKQLSADLHLALADLEGKVCSHFGPSTKEFFSYKLRAVK
ncbi:hypothetical protein N9C20_02205 [Luminiphilus sp.]|nr:hypothetical protein [Luminiphilus sp.]